MIYIWEI